MMKVNTTALYLTRYQTTIGSRLTNLSTFSKYRTTSVKRWKATTPCQALARYSKLLSTFKPCGNTITISLLLLMTTTIATLQQLSNLASRSSTRTGKSWYLTPSTATTPSPRLSTPCYASIGSNPHGVTLTIGTKKLNIPSTRCLISTPLPPPIAKKTR